MYGFNGLKSIADRKDRTERRRAGRVRCSSLTCQFGDVADLSRSGARVRPSRSAAPLAIDDRADLTFQSPLEPLTVAAKVVWLRKSRLGRAVIGFQFIEPDAHQRCALAELAQVSVDRAYLPPAPTPDRPAARDRRARE